ncbi:MAG TPA: class I SAM-dependent methyltransferase [Thermoanaerobaculia bacterium]|nr:class I SAM-dependent methyltransferase [Thermoanaerobaculia bacterium]
MSRLRIVKYRPEEYEQLPEARLLLADTVAVARRVYDEVDLVVVGPGDVLPSAAPGDVLVLGPSNVLLRVPSLLAMAAAAAGGDVMVYPARLADFEVLREDPVYTLGGYERAERRILDQGLQPRTSVAFHLPVSLMPPDLYARFLAGRPADELAVPPAEAAIAAGARRCVRRGIFHEFIEYYDQVRDDVLPFVPEGTRTVLEIGCGRGGTAEVLEGRLGCRVTGVELNPVAAAEAGRRIHRVVHGDVEALDLGGSFDLVLALEVIEHLVEPDRFLLRMRSLTRPGGRILLSTPNVGHYSVVEDLLRGRWDYVPGGAMCYTHLRFFTRRTLESLLLRAGFDRFLIEAQTTELPEQWSAPREGRAGELATDSESLRTLAFYVVIDL